MTLALFSVGKSARVICGDSAVVLRSLADNSVDSVVTDPPAGIRFMGRAWDGDRGGREKWIAWLAGILGECRRVLKPGGHSLVWALPRTSHWTGIAIEDGGFEIRDRVTHLFGDGMPKSHYVLKPGAEDWWLARKPIKGSIAANIAKHGTGGLNIEACLLDGVKEVPASRSTATGYQGLGAVVDGTYTPGSDPLVGRWPANVTLDEQAAEMLDAQSGTRSSGGYPAEGGLRPQGATFERQSKRGEALFGASNGGASRFFYVAKARDGEKTEGGAVENDHETVKSIALMRWLVRLVTPPGGLVLDAFAGSGTTGIACANEGMSFIGIEQSKKHHATAMRRLERWFGAVGDSL